VQPKCHLTHHPHLYFLHLLTNGISEDVLEHFPTSRMIPKVPLNGNNLRSITCTLVKIRHLFSLAQGAYGGIRTVVSSTVTQSSSGCVISDILWSLPQTGLSRWTSFGKIASKDVRRTLSDVRTSATAIRPQTPTPPGGRL
jgi:hypothetical protein